MNLYSVIHCSSTVIHSSQKKSPEIRRNSEQSVIVLPNSGIITGYKNIKKEYKGIKGKERIQRRD